MKQWMKKKGFAFEEKGPPNEGEEDASYIFYERLNDSRVDSEEALRDLGGETGEMLLRNPHPKALRSRKETSWSKKERIRIRA